MRFSATLFNKMKTQSSPMMLTRRAFFAGAASLSLSACLGGGIRATPPGATRTMRPQPNPAFDAWVDAYAGRARNAGIAPRVLDRALSGAGFLPDVIARDRRQTEFTRTLEDYMAIAASDARIAAGKRALDRMPRPCARSRRATACPPKC